MAEKDNYITIKPKNNAWIFSQVNVPKNLEFKAFPAIASFNPANILDWQSNPFWYLQIKYDGSQITFIRQPDDSILAYNKNKKISKSNKIFGKTITMFSSLVGPNLNSDYEYHGESITSIKHNLIEYERTPKYYFILFDIYDMVKRQYLTREEMEAEAKRLNIDFAETVYKNTDPKVLPKEKIKELMLGIEEGSLKSYLGGQIEGLVLKCDSFAYKFRKNETINRRLALKSVRDSFKEKITMKLEKSEMGTIQEKLEQIGQNYNTEARFHKAIQHLKERGEYKNNVKDMLNIVYELDNDFEKEYKEEVCEYLWAEFSDTIKANARKGFVDYYKQNYFKKN